MPSKECAGTPSVNSPVDSIYFERARIFLPGERNAIRVKIAERVGRFCEQLQEAIQSDQNLAPLVKEARELIEKLNCPIPHDHIEDINPKMGEKPDIEIRWKDVKDYYSIKEYARIDRALRPLELDDTDLNQAWRLYDILFAYSAELSESLENSDQRVIQIVNQYNIETDSGWHEDYFGAIESTFHKTRFGDVSNRFGIPLSRIRTFDIGCGKGRCIHQFEQIFGASDPRHKRGVLYGYHGIDICPGNIDATRNTIKKALDQASVWEKFLDTLRGTHYTPERIAQMDIFSKEIHIPPESIHYSFSFMRTIFHCDTENKGRLFLELLAKTLIPGNEKRPGGMATFDTVDLPIERLTSEEARANLDDLSHFYFQQILAYRRRYQEHMPEGVELSDMPRYPIYDNTTGKGFYWREIITPEYTRYLIEKYELDLEVVDQQVKTPSAPKTPASKEEMVALGLKWMQENALEDPIEAEIRQRLERGEINEILFTQAKASHFGLVEHLKREVAYRWVAEFPAQFITVQRPQKSTPLPPSSDSKDLSLAA